MSPLLTARPSVSVTLRLLGACLVMALAAAAVPFFGGDGRSSAAVPAALAIGITCAALDQPPAVRLRQGDRRPAAGVAVGRHDAGADRPRCSRCSRSRACSRAADRSSRAPTRAPRATCVWHVALVAAAGIALAGVEPKLRSLLIFGGLGALLLAWAAVASTPFGDLASDEGYSPTMRALVALIVAAQAGVAVVWWRRAGGAVSWADMCVLAMMGARGAGRLRLPRRLRAVRRRVVGDPRAARRAVRGARRRAADRLHRRRGEAARVRGGADREPGRRARARGAQPQELRDARRAAPRADPLAHADADRRRRAGRRVPADRRPGLRARGRRRGAGALPRARRRRRSRPSAASSTRTRSTWACRWSWR